MLPQTPKTACIRLLKIIGIVGAWGTFSDRMNHFELKNEREILGNR